MTVIASPMGFISSARPSHRTARPAASNAVLSVPPMAVAAALAWNASARNGAPELAISNATLAAVVAAKASRSLPNTAMSVPMPPTTADTPESVTESAPNTAAAAAMHRVAEIRRTQITGRLNNHERRVGENWVVTLNGQEIPVNVQADRAGATVSVGDRSLRVESGWKPGMPLAEMMVDDEPLVMKVERIPAGYRLRTRGADLKTQVRRPRAAELARLMPEKLPPDTSRFLLCPMPGLVVGINVAPGDEVQEGQALATVEAMKMENILRAERKGVVKSVSAARGESLKVDDVIMEFE